MNLSAAFETFINANFIKYKGCTIEVCGTHFKVLGLPYATLDLAKKAIDESLKSFGNNIKKNL